MFSFFHRSVDIVWRSHVPRGEAEVVGSSAESQSIAARVIHPRLLVGKGPNGPPMRSVINNFSNKSQNHFRKLLNVSAHTAAKHLPVSWIQCTLQSSLCLISSLCHFSHSTGFLSVAPFTWRCFHWTLMCFTLTFTQRCLYFGMRRTKVWYDFPKGGRSFALLHSLNGK